MKQIIFAALVAAATFNNAIAECKWHSFTVGVEFPDGSFVERNLGSLPDVGLDNSIASLAGVSQEIASQRADAIRTSLALFKADPFISRARLSEEIGSQGRVFLLRHWCNDDVVNRHVYPRNVGYAIREDSSMKIWAKDGK